MIQILGTSTLRKHLILSRNATMRLNDGLIRRFTILDDGLIRWLIGLNGFLNPFIETLAVQSNVSTLLICFVVLELVLIGCPVC